VHPVDLSAVVIRDAVRRSGIPVEELGSIDDVLWGCATPEGPQGMNVARMALLRAGLPVEVSGATVNRFCSSGLQTIAMASQAIATGMADVVIAGGVEMMSRTSLGGAGSEFHHEMVEAYIGMGFTAERVAEQWGVSREDQDAWALRSHQRAAAARAEGRFDAEVVSVPVRRVRWEGTRQIEDAGEFDQDELIRADTSLEQLAKLRPAFRVGGTVTAGNSSPFSDGAAALVLMSRERADELGAPVLARLVTFATGGVPPEIMGIGPIRAVPKALERAGVPLSRIDRIELNEAFSAQVLPVMRELGLPEDRTNVDGGAIALGHPLGATGAKLATQMIHALRGDGGGLGLVTMCVGGGMGAAGILEVYGEG
jgi:acetyl-CoA acyltransferase